MTPTHIFLDLDDVLNTFTPYILSQLGCPIEPDSYAGYPAEAGWNIVRAANILHPEKQFSEAGFWAGVHRAHWATVPRSAEFNQLIRWSLLTVGSHNMRILTQATLDPECLAGKREWLIRNCPDWLRDKYLMVGKDCKHLCARPGALLIDDNEDNVCRFRSEGGKAILMPRPWNSLRRMGKGQIRGHIERSFAEAFHIAPLEARPL